MTPERWSRIKAIFSVAIELPAAERAAYVEREADGDADIAAEVNSLLASHEAPGEFLDRSNAQLLADAMAQQEDRIGPWRIVSLLGTGGMGDVFRAVRADEQYRAEVAIKLMRADLRNALSDQRFRTERQILAQLDHRNIARLLDGGSTASGIPYVVMELVEGMPITEYCEAHSLDLKARVQLFLQVCAAVSFAHQRLVVHRDLKPGNILVTGDGSVKLLDFGIAKLLEGNSAVPGADATVTQFRAMTLEYASPEQVRGRAITTVSDVYSLGVVLFKLLTGHSPYARAHNDAQRLAEILSDDNLARPGVSPELDDMLLMALRKDPRQRYASVDALASDLRQYLSGGPVAARGKAFRYLLGKFIRRHRFQMAAVGLVVVSLLGGMVFAMREARIAQGERVIAQRHFNSVRSLAHKLLFDIHDEIARVPKATAARDLLVETSREYLENLSRGAGTDPALQLELAQAWKKLGDIQGADLEAASGDARGAMKSYERAIDLLERRQATSPIDAAAAALLSEARADFARTEATLR